MTRIHDSEPPLAPPSERRGTGSPPAPNSGGVKVRTSSLRLLRIGAGGLLLILCSLFAALPARAQTVVVKVGGSLTWKIPDKNASDPQSRADRAVVEAFERQHPNIVLENANGLQVSGPAAESNLLMAFAGGTAPDVVYVNFRTMTNYIQQGFLAPLDDDIAAHPEMLRRINPLILNVITVDHHIYAMPYSQFVMALYYRRDVFQQAGLDPDKPPATWDEFYDDCKRITNHKTGIWGFEWPNSAEGVAYWWDNLLWQAGGDVIARNPQGKWVAVFDSPSGVEALKFYSKLVSAPYVDPKDGQTYIGVAGKDSASWSSTDRTEGKVAMWFGYQSNVIANTSDANTINPSLIGIAAMPKGPHGQTANEINAAMWGLSSQIKDPNVRTAAWQFIRFMASDEADKIRTKAYVDAGLGNLINPLTLIKYGYGDQVTGVSKSWLEANKTLFAHGHPEPYGANMQVIYQILGQPIQAIGLNPDADPQALLANAARQVDDKLIGYTPPRVLARRRLIAEVIFTAVCIVIGLLLARQAARWRASAALHRALPADESDTPVLSARRKRQVQLVAWLFMIPAVLSIAVWAYWPLARGLVMAFQDYKVIKGAHFVGLDNFIDVFTAPTFWIGLLNAALYTIYSLALGFALPIALAWMLSEIPKGTVFFRTLYYLPAVTSGLVISLLWMRFESPDQSGLLNTLLHAAHIPPQNWLGDPHWAMISIILPGIWAGTGPGCIIYLAALQGIPDEMYEAADLDGASVWTKIWRITIPTLRPLILINLVGATIGAFKAMENIFIMTGGGPLYATHTIGLEIFYNAFLYLKFGYATAAAWVMGSLLIGFTLFQLRTIRTMRFTRAG